MEIQKEREAFESKLKQIGKVDDSNFTVADDGSYEWDSIHFAWTIWQAAKAQAVPEGFVLVPKEPTPKMIDATWDFDDEIQEMSHNSRNEFIYKAMIEAREQSHD